jgi:anti-sigma regulatory factor (Ser/Thr protein kinase)
MTDRTVDDLRLEICSDPRLLGLIRGVLQTWLEILGLEADRRSEIVLAVDEACSNAIRHAYGGRTDERIELVLSLSSDWIEITVSDEGTPCPSECSEYKPIQRPEPDEVQPGGLGVKLIHEVFDEVRFCPGTRRGNCVTMRLRRNEEHGVASED